MNAKRKSMLFSLNTQIEEILRNLSQTEAITMSEVVRKSIEFYYTNRPIKK